MPLDDYLKISDEYKAFEEKIIADEEYKMLNIALNELKKEYREVLHLLYYEELSYKEIAKIMNKSEKQIDNYCYRGKISLKKKLEEMGFVYEK